MFCEKVIMCDPDKLGWKSHIHVREVMSGVHSQYSPFHLSSWPPWGWGGSLHPQMSHLLICCVTRFYVCVCVSVIFKYVCMIPKEYYYYFFFFLQNRDDSMFLCAPRPHRDVPFHIQTLPGPTECWVKSLKESAQMLCWCCVLKCTVINVIWHIRLL